MRPLLALAVVFLGAAASACSTTTSGTATNHATSPLAAQSKSTIVSQMENYYQESPVIAIDPCHDTFIHDMEKNGFTLSADVILPEGRQIFDHWYAACQYSSGSVSALIDSSTAPFMAPDETLEPKHKTKGWSRLIEIEGREGIVRPSTENGGGCMVSMATSFGSMTSIGGDHRTTDPEGDCDLIVDLLRQIEPWIND